MTDPPEALQRQMVSCPTCHGEGRAYYGDNTGYVKCWNPLCMGTGKVPEPSEVWALRNAAIALEILNAAYPESVTYWHMSREQMIARKLEDAANKVERKEQGNDQPR